jgi:hypothetical protein
MKLLIVYVPALLIAWRSLAAQEPPAKQVDTAATRRTERIERQNAIDSLAAGQRRWKEAGVVEYRLQTNYHCFCPPNRDDMPRPRDLLTIRDGRIIKRSAGKGHPSYTDHTSWTVDSLFDVVADDLADQERKVRRLELSPVYGFPVRYSAGRVEYEDHWIEIAVDSFAVVRKATGENRRRPR